MCESASVESAGPSILVGARMPHGALGTPPREARVAASRWIEDTAPTALEALSDGVCAIRRAVPEDVEPIAASMRVADVAELEGLNGTKPADALWEGLAMSDLPMTATVRGEPAAMFGARTLVTASASIGVVWMLATAAVTARRRWFLVASRVTLLHLAAGRDSVGCLVDGRYTASLHWLRSLGFYRPPGGDVLGHTGLPYQWWFWRDPRPKV